MLSSVDCGPGKFARRQHLATLTGEQEVVQKLRNVLATAITLPHMSSRMLWALGASALAEF